jgi:hypothetical protein
MLNQSFSAESFQEIFDKENRKGKNIENLFKVDFQNTLTHLKSIQLLTKAIKNEPDKDKRKILYADRKKLKKEREELILEVLEKASIDLPKRVNEINLINGPIIGKQTYILDTNIQNFFMSKKVQWNILKTYKVKQANRYEIITQLINLLEDKFPKYVLRTDIKSFYESIPQNPLRNKINDDYLLSILSKRFINRIFEEYNRLTSQDGSDDPKGIPRGIGISPYLSELYMRQVDKQIKGLKDVVYYSRYVDDIIIVFIPEKKELNEQQLKKYDASIKSIINLSCLEINDEKTKNYNLLNNLSEIRTTTLQRNDGVDIPISYVPNPKTIDFLGYKIGSQQNRTYTSSTDKTKITEKLSIDMSENKLDKYENRIKIAFEEYKNKKMSNPKVAYKLLYSRIEFLSSNIRLRNNKAGVLIGIYYSNVFVNNMQNLQKIDKGLKYYLSRAGFSAAEKDSFNKFSFVLGFCSKKYIQIPLKKETYKNHNSKKNDLVNAKNKGVLRYGLKEINSIWK